MNTNKSTFLIITILITATAKPTLAGTFDELTCFFHDEFYCYYNATNIKNGEKIGLITERYGSLESNPIESLHGPFCFSFEYAFSSTDAVISLSYKNITGDGFYRTLFSNHSELTFGTTIKNAGWKEASITIRPDYKEIYSLKLEVNQLDTAEGTGLRNVVAMSGNCNENGERRTYYVKHYTAPLVRAIVDTTWHSRIGRAMSATLSVLIVLVISSFLACFISCRQRKRKTARRATYNDLDNESNEQVEDMHTI